jgi:hypothetical protein
MCWHLLCINMCMLMWCQLRAYWHAVCSERHAKHINTLCGHNIECFHVKPGGKRSQISTWLWKIITRETQCIYGVSLNCLLQLQQCIIVHFFPLCPSMSYSRYHNSCHVNGKSEMGARFFASVQTDPGAHPASYTMGTGSFPGVKRPGRGADHPPPTSAEVKERVDLYLYSPSGPSWPVLGKALPLPLQSEEEVYVSE